MMNPKEEDPEELWKQVLDATNTPRIDRATVDPVKAWGDRYFGIRDSVLSLAEEAERYLLMGGAFMTTSLLGAAFAATTPRLATAAFIGFWGFLYASTAAGIAWIMRRRGLEDLLDRWLYVLALAGSICLVWMGGSTFLSLMADALAASLDVK